MKINRQRLKSILDNITGKRIIVFGDLMVDQYLRGRVRRLSPEAPVPIVETHHEEIRLGGAANVALNLHELGAECIVIGLIGKDRIGNEFRVLLEKNGMIASGVVESPSRPSTVKTRIIGDNQHIARVDNESIENANTEEKKDLLSRFDKHLANCEGVIIEDYNKGVLTSSVIQYVIEKCNFNDIPVFVDPKFNHFMDYKNVTLFKPNLKETEQALAREIKSEKDLKEAGKTLLKTLNLNALLITLGAKGMVLFEDNGNIVNIPTQAQNVADVSGAGDTVISTFASAFVAGASHQEAAMIATVAAGYVVGHVGIVPVTKNILMDLV